MEQTIHILKKDIRYLRLEIGMVLVLASCFGLMHNTTIYPWWVLLAIAAVYLIVRLVHAEPIPGDNQFWITRPYEWRSLLVAKLLFVFLFVNLPVFAAQFAVFVRDGFPVGANLGGLAWGLLLMFVGVALPVAALASMTTGLTQFLLYGILLFAMVGNFVPSGVRPELDWPRQVLWIRLLILSVPIMLVSGCAVVAQYRKRNTFVSRTVTAGAIAFALLASWSVPAAWAMDFQRLFSPNRYDSSRFNVTLDPEFGPRITTTFGADQVRLDFPFGITDLTDDEIVVADLHSLTLSGSDGQVWEAESIYRGNQWPFSNSPGALRQSVPLPRDIFDRWRDDPVTIRATFYFTVFGEPETETVTISLTDRELLPQGLECGLDDRTIWLGQPPLRCRSPFRGPGLFATVLTDGGEEGPFITGVSYSPFPSTLDLNQISWQSRFPDFMVGGERVAYDLSEGANLTMVFREPLAHLRRDVELTVDLDDFARESQP
jgi:hypothetical protein